MNLMGVDIGIHKVSMFMLLDQEVVHVAELDISKHDQDFSRAYELRALAAEAHNQVLMWGLNSVWIEDTLDGNNIKYSIAIAEVKGAVMAAMAGHTDVRLVNVSTWKKNVAGRGNASKDQVRDYIDVTHPAYAPLCGDSQDLYDACCVALYGRQIMGRAADLRLLPG